ncbi:MAG TPA: isoprenylcysteine carboxylmethyltransferase family protein [Pantanalinema sp.]
MDRTKVVLISLLGTVVLAALMFGCAGRWELPNLWGYMVLTGIEALVLGLVIDPDLARERLHPGPGGHDWSGVWVMGLAYVMHLAIACLDVGRFHWSDTVPVALQALGAIAYAAGLAVGAWAMGVNRFFSSVIRIQRDRGQVVVTQGPYHYMRHPGYAAGILSILGSPLFLGSWWAMAPCLVMLVAMLRRTVREDALLKRELPGYADYARAVPFRLLPGVW